MVLLHSLAETSLAEPNMGETEVKTKMLFSVSVSLLIWWDCVDQGPQVGVLGGRRVMSCLRNVTVQKEPLFKRSAPGLKSLSM